MLTHTFNLKENINMKQWQAIQDSMAKVTGLAIVLIDYKGAPISEHSCRQRFCDLMRNDPNHCKYCERSDAHAGLESARIDKPYMYLCPANIVDVAIPIIVDEKYLGAVMAGQVVLSEAGQCEMEKTFTNEKLEAGIRLDVEMRQAYQSMPKLAADEIRDRIDLIEKVSKGMMEESLIRSLLAEMIRPHIKDRAQWKNIKHASLNTLSGIRNPIILIPQPSKQSTSESYSPIIQIAVDYVSNNFQKKITLQDVAEFCHISKSYLSRIFKKELGKSFVDYIMAQKIQFAMEEISTRNISLSEVSENCGFSDASYFIKQFKKIVGVTPSDYRKTAKMKTT